MNYLIIDAQELINALNDFNIKVTINEHSIDFYTDGYDTEGKTWMDLKAKFDV
jgi:hypothetical protein